MREKFIRFPLRVEAEFTKEGAFEPKCVIVDGEHFPISAILRKRNFTPPGITCFLPVEYTVVIRGREKCIYYEPLTNKWFSLKKEKKWKENISP